MAQRSKGGKREWGSGGVSKGFEVEISDKGKPRETKCSVQGRLGEMNQPGREGEGGGRVAQGVQGV